MNCIKCGKQLPEGAVWCCWCGRKQIREKHTRHRGNGEGTVYKRPNGTYVAVVSHYYLAEDGTKKRQTRSKTCKTKKEAVAALPDLIAPTTAKKKIFSFQKVYDAWLPTHKASKGTMNCYKAAYKWFQPLWSLPMDDIDVGDLQECIDTCGKGKRTQQNMKTLIGLMYKYAIPRHMVSSELNMAEYLIVGGDATAKKQGFDKDQLELIKSKIGTVPYADYIYCMCYLGFRPGEALALNIEDYNLKNQCIRGGSKTEAGIDRLVTVSPKIQGLMADIIGRRKTGKIFGRNDELKDDYSPITLRYWDNLFLETLEKIGIDNPTIEDKYGNKRHVYVAHSVRRTFATLLKAIPGSDKDKLELIGHTSDEMLRYYQDVSVDDLRAITDVI